jgi:D-aminoacyl-tRNA deacylase
MRAVVQRVSKASVTIEGKVHASIGQGYVVLLGIKTGDTSQASAFLADKCAGLRVFEDENGKMNLGLNDVNGRVIVVSQFTLYGDAQRGNRPSFTEAARPEEAEPLYDLFVSRMKSTLGDAHVATGIFRATMEVNIVNDGPVTILIESK